MNALFLYFFSFYITIQCEASDSSQKCYIAKTCIHNAIAKCGKDSAGNVRDFYDSCDMKEFNCLNNADYKKIPQSNCKGTNLSDDFTAEIEKMCNEDENPTECRRIANKLSPICNKNSRRNQHLHTHANNGH